MKRARTVCIWTAYLSAWVGCSHPHIDLGDPSESPADVTDMFGRAPVPVPDGPPSSSPAPEPPSVLGPPSRNAEVAMQLEPITTLDKAPAAISGGTMAVSPDGAYVVIADPDRDAIYVVTPAAMPFPRRTIAMAAGSEPGRVVLDGAGGAHVVLRSDGSLVRIDVSSATVVFVTNVCSLPRGVAYDAPRDLVWVACASGELVSLAAQTHAVHSRQFVELDLRDVIVADDATVYVSRYRSAQLLAVADDGSITQRSIPASTTQFSPGMPLPRTTARVFAVPASSPTQAWRTIRAPNGAPWMLHERAQDDPVEAKIMGGYGAGCNTIVSPRLTRYDTRGVPADSMPLDATLAVDIAVSADMAWVALANPAVFLAGEPTLSVVPMTWLENAAIPEPDRDSPAPVSVDSTCLCADCMAFATGHQVTSVAFDAVGRLYAFARDPAILLTFDATLFGTSAPSATSLAPASASARDSGHALFHADVGNRLACASCHGEALDDGHVWNFAGVGPRRTQSIRGGLLATAPFHWQGDLPSFEALVTEVLTKRMGGSVMTPGAVAALGSWIDKLPALRVPNAAAEQTARGRALFESTRVGCSECHSGAALTNNQSADVGTGEVFQVPSLRGLSLRAPFMHNGCAKTLEDRFTQECGGDRHGHTDTLSSDERADLIAYLSSL